MDSAAPRIPQSEWDRWKDTIVDLISDKTLEELMKFMKDENNFIASRSQYQKQLHTWKDRKNLTRDEWADIFEIQEKLSSRKIESRIFISGRPVPPPKIQRARRNCMDKSRISKNRTMREANSAFSRNVSMEILGADGKWTPYVNPDDVVNESDQSHNEVRGELMSPNSQAVGGNSFGMTGADFGGISDLQMDDGLDHFDIEATSSYQDFSDISGTQDLDMGAVDGESFPQYLSNVLPSSPSMAMIQFPSQQELSDFWVFDNGLTNNSTNSPSQISFTRLFDFQIPTHEIPCDLPFKRFEDNLKDQGIHLATRSFNNPGFKLASMVGNPAKLFLEDIWSSMPEIDKDQNQQRHLNAESLLLSLKGLLSHEDPHGGCDNRQSLITDDEILQTKFNKLLVFSIVNGFAGLQDVPIQSVLKYLSRHGDISSLLLQFLQASQSHAAKALAENLFRAAIEGKDERALKRLLAIGLVDVNTTICIVNSEKYTPIERAASLRDLGIVELLLSAKADVNKTCALHPTGGGALQRLFTASRSDQGIAPEIAEISNLLLKAGAKVHLHFYYEYFRCYELSYSLFSAVSNFDHSEFIRDGNLVRIAEQLDDWHATEVIKKIFLACEQTKCGRCLSHFERQVDLALIQGAKHGHLQLVQLLLSHSKTPHRAFSAAIRSGKRDMIDIVLTLKPDIDAPAHSINTDDELVLDQHATTSLAEAVEAGDKKLIQMIEETGSLKRLNEAGRFEPVIAAASKNGDIVYVRKLLSYFPSPEPREMARALFYAIQEGHEDIFFKLLASGASVNYRNRNRVSPLVLAMLRRNHRMMHEILNADINLEALSTPAFVNSEEITIFREAVKWGDESIIQDLRSAFPDKILSPNELSEALKMKNMVWFEFLLRSGMASVDALTNCLEIALSRGDSELVHYLIEWGADPTNNAICKICAERCFKMLPLLLKQARLRFGHLVVPRFGTDALNAAIKNGPAGFEAVKVLLDSELVDAGSLCNYSFSKKASPLGLAIRQSRNGDHAEFLVIKKLLDSGCDPNAVATRSLYGHFQIIQTVLLEAIETKSKDLVELVISRGALVRPKTMIGLRRTPLQRAVEVDSLKLVTLILEAGADVNDKPANHGGATALQLAAIGGNCNIALKLLERGAEMEALPAQVDGRWPLEGAAEYGRLEMIELLWKLSTADFNQKHCRRAMELAEGNGHMACRDLIAELSQASVASTSVLN